MVAAVGGRNAMSRKHNIFKVTLVGSVGNLILLIFKFVAGIVGHSSAMIADAIHSLSDFATDVLVVFFVNISSRPQDKSHDYGHGKYETIASFVIGLALAAAALGIVVSGAMKFIGWLGGKQLEVPGRLALWAALVSIAVKEALYRYTVHVGRTENSQVVIANAWHHRSDAMSSIGAALGIGGAIVLGDKWAVLDPIASIVVGLMLAMVAVKLLKNSVDELTEASLPSDDEDEILALIESEPDVSEPHNLRTRRIGNRIAIDVHVRMDGEVTLEHSHQCATSIEHKLKARFGSDTHVTVHMEPTK